MEACNEGDISKVRKLLDEGRVSVHDTTEEGESLLSLACSAGYFELAQVSLQTIREDPKIKSFLNYFSPLSGNEMRNVCYQFFDRYFSQ